MDWKTFSVIILKTMQYLDYTHFMDKVHLKWEYLRANRAGILAQLLSPEVMAELSPQ